MAEKQQGGALQPDIPRISTEQDSRIRRKQLIIIDLHMALAAALWPASCTGAG